MSIMNQFFKLASTLIAGLSLFIGATAGAQDIDVTIEKEDGFYLGRTPGVLNSHETAFLFHQIGVDNEESNLMFFLKYSSGKGNEINEILLHNEGTTGGELLFESGKSFPVVFTIWDDTPEKSKKFAADVYIAFSPYVLRSDKKDNIDYIKLATYNMVYSNLVSIKIGNQTIPIKELGFKTAKQFTAIWEKLENINAFTGKNRYLVPLKQKPTASKTSSSQQHEWVDLGLSVKWATCNIGASSPEDYGDYFAWGEVSPKKEYTLENYVFRISGDDVHNVRFSKYNTNPKQGTVDNKTRLDYSDDAARKNWGGQWRIPTESEWNELVNECTWTWTTRNGHNGYLVTSKKNGKSIFLSAAGSYTNKLSQDNIEGTYWSSNLDRLYIPSFCGKGIWLGIEEKSPLHAFRHSGHPIRPVTD